MDANISSGRVMRRAIHEWRGTPCALPKGSEPTTLPWACPQAIRISRAARLRCGVVGARVGRVWRERAACGTLLRR